MVLVLADEGTSSPVLGCCAWRCNTERVLCRYMFASIGMLCLVGITGDDILYEPLPLYHTAGGNIGVGMTLCDSVTVALRRKFSVTNYFPDCKKYNCTVKNF